MAISSHFSGGYHADTAREQIIATRPFEY